MTNQQKLQQSVKTSPGVFCCLSVVSQSFRFQRFISAAGARTALYYVNDKVGKLEVEFERNLTRHF